MIKVHEPPKRATESATRSPNFVSSSIISLGWRLARTRTSCCEARSNRFELHLRSRYGRVFVIKAPKRGKASQYLRAARHRSPLVNRLIVESGLHKSRLRKSPGIFW